MVEATSPLGGSVTVSYQPATDFPNGPGFGTAPVATSVAVADGRGSTATTTYSYAGGAANKLERQSLGFQTVKATLPCLATETPPCPYRLRTFKQTLASAGSVLAAERHGGDGTFYSKQAYTYDERDALPRRSRVASTTSTSYGPPGTERSATVTYDVYDEYGNLRQSTAQGAPNDPEDDVRTVYSFSPNTSDYIVDRIAKIEQGAPGGPPLTREERWYDNQGAWQNAPIKGELTTLRRYLDPDGRWVAKTFEYASTGVLSSVSDETGRSTQFDYDQSWALFPVSVTTPVGSVLQNWDPRCGALESTTRPT
jgi:hypothetical protein